MKYNPRILLRIVYINILCILFATPTLAIDKCSRGQRNTCVVDGDTFWLDGVKYRTAGYDTPEPYTNICGGRREVELANRATARFIEIWNTYEIEIQPLNRQGSYGRDLVVVYANGHNVGDILVAEGLARYWPDGNEFWCR